MKVLIPIIVLFLAGCSTPQRQVAVRPPQRSYIAHPVMRPLTISEVATVKGRFSRFSAYMTMDECMEILDLPDDRQYPASVFGKKPAIGISMTLHDDSLLFIRCDQRGYVVQAQLDDEKWEWAWDPGKKDPQ